MSKAIVPKPFVVSPKVEFPLRRIADLLVGAFEGGSNYWIDVVEVAVPAEGFGSAKPGDDDYYPRIIRTPLSGGALRIEYGNEEGSADHKVLDRRAIQRGLELLAKSYPARFASIVTENDDAEDSDVLLQLALFGEVVYG
jgi:hypothetical protein